MVEPIDHEYVCFGFKSIVIAATNMHILQIVSSMLFIDSIASSCFMSNAYQLVCVAAFFIKVCESFPFSIALSWEVDSPVLLNDEVEIKRTVIFPKGNAIPNEKVVTFYGFRTFSIDVNYLQATTRISTYKVI
jgi:hypothetical protein